MFVYVFVLRPREYNIRLFYVPENKGGLIYYWKGWYRREFGRVRQMFGSKRVILLYIHLIQNNTTNLLFFYMHVIALV